MKRHLLLLTAILITHTVIAQTDSTFIDSTDTGMTAVVDTTLSAKKDTIRIGNITIIKNHKGPYKHFPGISVNRKTAKKNSRITTNWWMVDLGFSNYDDKTDYATVGDYLVNSPGGPDFNRHDFRLKTGKSINVNIWAFMQRLAIGKGYFNLKYGLGVELNNYRFKSNISFREDGEVPYSGGMITNAPFVFRDSITFSKNKLAADYLTVPFMLNFRSNPKSVKNSLNISFGVSAGYLYSQRNKQKSTERGKMKNKGDYDLNRFKFSYVGEIGMGPVTLYGSYSPKSIFDNNMDFRPYNVGLRIGRL